MTWWEDPDLVQALTAIVRKADEQHLRDGGSTRHWVRDCFLPLLAESDALDVREGYERRCWEYDNEDDFLGVEYVRENVYYEVGERWPRVLVVRTRTRNELLDKPESGV